MSQDTLFHGETLFVVTSGNTKHITFPLVTEDVGFDNLAHTFFIEHTQFVFVNNFEKFLASRYGI
ncbi:hypothetical protein FF38_02834 [Lucilia cuprina]|uniref:Uncharacterized protein n=1 Tax=Lucilia cuprina TaxID=7375 RepID=A0A0L0BU14_LUCCU|nr:hypothetical protein FF38_02834 [Lucilia cuprina]